MQAIIKKRSLKMNQKISPDQLGHISFLLLEVEGIKKCITGPNPYVLQIEYDLMKVNLKKIEELMESHNYILSGQWLSKFKRGWLHFIEENEYVGQRSVPHSCCTPPK